VNLQLTKAAAWLNEKAASVKYGELSVKVIIHEGVVKRVERTQTEKFQEE
jgi:hypothetical protein